MSSTGRILDCLFARLIEALDTIGTTSPEDELEAQQREAKEQ